VPDHSIAVGVPAVVKPRRETRPQTQTQTQTQTQESPPKRTRASRADVGETQS